MDVAFISGIARLNDPWGDLVNYFRDATATAVKLRLIADAREQFLKRMTATRYRKVSDAAACPRRSPAL